MPFSHHSHSGQFCGHATDLLEDVIKEAIRQGMEVFCMTEHMPRDHEEDLYVEELAEGLTPTDLHNTFAGFIEEARRLQEVYKRQITLLVGTEIDWIRPTTCLASIEKLILKYRLDLLIGSVHHVHTIPIDFSQGLYVKAQEAAVKRAQASGSETDNNGLDAEQVLFSDYFDAQYHMLQEIRPPVVGHFDLIRLYSKLEREGRTSTMKSWTKVWNKVLRNLRLVREYGGCLEINSAALRKGLAEPYPSNDICKAFLDMEGQFTLSDDSHGVAQVGHSYAQTIEFMRSVGIQKLAVFRPGPVPGNGRFNHTEVQEVLVEILTARA